MIEPKQRVIFLDKIHLFNGLRENELAGIAQSLVEREIPKGRVVFKRGDKPDGFYMVYKGKVNITRPAEGGEQFLAWLAPGDYFGEEALFENRTRSATITAMDDSILLFLSKNGFDKLLAQYEKLKPNFQVAIKSRKLARATKFKWLGKNEVIYFIARRHIFRLYQALITPALSLLIPIFLLVWGSLTGAMTPIGVGGILLVGILGWGIWNTIDWSNDYYIVTNQRVIWLEKVIGLHDSREEAPLGTILSVGVETDYFGRIFDFGNVIVRTFVGKLEFDYVDHPAQAADMIREYWERAKAVTSRTQMDVMRTTIRQKLGLPVEKPPQLELSPVVAVNEEKIAKTPYWILALSNLFKLRQEEGGRVIYHKHWLVLLQKAWRPIGLFLLALALFILRIWILIKDETEAFLERNSAGALRPDTISVTIPLLMLPIGFWLWYEYTDWKNDTFMVTADEIFDIDRKPFGTEERRAAQIENILSTSYERSGFIAYIFNYGNVKISVGGNQLVFENVIDPAGVQADINRRRMVRIAKKNEDAGAADRDRFATWIAAYHQNIDNFNAPVAKPVDAASPTGPQNTVDGQTGPKIPIKMEDEDALETAMEMDDMDDVDLDMDMDMDAGGGEQ